MSKTKAVKKPVVKEHVKSKPEPKKRRMLIVDVPADPSTAHSAEALERSKVLTFPCKDCGAETNPSNRSILQDGRVVHIGCPKAKKSTPREVEARKPVLQGLPKHKGAKVPVRPPEPKSEFGDVVVMSDYQGRTCIQVKRDVNTVTYLPIDVGGFHLTYMNTAKFDERFKPIEYPVKKACEHFARYAADHGATQDVIAFLKRFVTISEANEMAAKKKMEGKVTTVSADGKTKVKAGGGTRQRAGSEAAEDFKALIMEGKLTDQEIWERVSKKHDLDEKKRYYVGWYRWKLKNEGKNPPEAKGGAKATEKKAKASKETPAKKGKAKSKK